MRVVVRVLAVALLLPGAPLGARAADEPLRATLDNGLRVVIVRNALAPVASTEMSYLVGSNEAPEGFPGMAHAEEHMMFRGSRGLTQPQLAAIGAAIGGDFNAATQQTATHYFFTVPSHHLELALRIEALRMGGALNEQAAWEAERPALEQEVAQDLSRPEYQLYTSLLAAAFAGTPYAHDALGTVASFRATTGAMLERFHETWYAPNNAILVIVGDVDPPAALAKVRELFGAIPAKALPPRPAVRLRPVAARTVRLESDLPYGLAVVAFRLPGYRSPDFAAVQVLADALASKRGALYRLVLEGHALETDFSLSLLPEVGLGYASAAFPRGGDGDAMLERLRRVLAQVAARGVPSTLVVAAKRAERAQLAFQKNSIGGLAQAWSQVLAVEGHGSPQEDVEAIERVTPAQVRRVARRELDLRHAIRAVLLPKASGAPVAATPAAGRESFAPEHAEEVELPDWARAALERAAMPRWTLNPASLRLANGIRLIVQPVSISDTVSVYGHIRGRASVQAPPGEEGVDELLDKLFAYGTTTLGQAEFQKALDDIGANAEAGRDFSLEVLREHFERGVELLAQNELHPALPEKAFAVVRAQAAAALPGVLQSASFLARHALAAALFPPHDPELRHPTPQSLKRLTLAGVRRYYERTFRPDVTTLVVIGNVTPERAREVIERHFGGWQARGPQPPLELPPVPLSSPAATAVPDASRVQDQVTLAQTLGLTRHDRDYYALELGNRILGSGFYASRLYRDLRETTGLVYYVGSEFEVGRTRGLYVARYGCDPQNVARARAIIERDLRAMQREPVSARELRQAKALALSAIPLSQSSVREVAAGFLERARLDLPLDEPRRAAERYASLDAEAIRAAYAKWLRVDALSQVTQGPPPR